MVDPEGISPSTLEDYREELVAKREATEQNIARFRAALDQSVGELNHIIGAIVAIDKMLGRKVEGPAA